jgi:NAD(P)-dependent dehydrogenase (short-subunit alcohol dehydrogenase family)
MRLANKIAHITGAARGIGAAIAEAFVREGAHVVLSDIAVVEVEQTAMRLGARAIAMQLDVRIEQHWQEVHAAILARFGQLDIVVNNAGITGFEVSGVAHDPEHAMLADWHAVHAVNLDGVFLGCKYAVQAMRRSGRGSIINISSRSGMVGIPAAAAYASSKAAARRWRSTAPNRGLRFAAIRYIQPPFSRRCGSRCWAPAKLVKQRWRRLLPTRHSGASVCPKKSRWSR